MPPDRLPSPEIIEADLTWTGEAFTSGIQLRLDAAGRIAEAGPLGAVPTRRLRGQALLPGMVSAHSHAFQRGLRGQGERFPVGVGSFWSWREAMYDLAARLDGDGFERLCRHTFQEMRAAGITTVGEFHYFHHDRETAEGQSPDYAMDARVLRAAAATGIRIALLNTYYRTGGIAQPLTGAQRRFESPEPAVFWEQMDRLAANLDGPLQTLGAAVHSVRAATPAELGAIYTEARRRNLAIHMHIEEQRREIDDCFAHYGQRPMQLLLATLPSAQGFTAIHCTHTSPQDMEGFLAAGGAVCLCPLTEANLGDGLPDLALPHRAGSRLCLGSDSNARISMLEEMRWLEYGQRLRGESRGALRDAGGDVARTLLHAATTGGASALGLPCGELTAGRWADCVAIDLEHPSLDGADAASLLPALLFGAGDDAIVATAVAGTWQQRTPRGQDQRAANRGR